MDVDETLKGDQRGCRRADDDDDGNGGEDDVEASETGQEREKRSWQVRREIIRYRSPLADGELPLAHTPLAGVGAAPR